MSALPQNLLNSQQFIDLPADCQQAVQSDDDIIAANAMLDAIEAQPLFSSHVQSRSLWLGQARRCAVRLEERCPEQLEVRLLAAIARTAFAARETSAGLAAAELALSRAVETNDLDAQVAILAGRLPFVAANAPVDAARDVRMLESILAQLPPPFEESSLPAEIALAHIAWYGAAGQYGLMRKELAQLGRMQLPQDDALSFVAYASQVALAQLYLRSRQRTQAVMAMMEAARLADAHGANAELANLQALIAAIAMQAGDFDSAVAHARSAVDAAKASTCRHAQPDPWLGFPIDIGLVDSPAAAVQNLAEAVLSAQDLGDATGFLMAATAMPAFYLADDRALEALDALAEATEVAHALEDPDVADTLRKIAEGLLGHLGILRQ